MLSLSLMELHSVSLSACMKFTLRVGLNCVIARVQRALNEGPPQSQSSIHSSDVITLVALFLALPRVKLPFRVTASL